MRGSWGAFVVVVGLVGLVGVAGLAGVGCGSSSPPPAPGQGGGGLAGAAGSCPDTSTPTDLPIKINNVDECPFVGADTAGCGAGTFEYDCPDPLGLGVPPEAGCTHPTSGTNTTMRWCCTSALCSRFFSRDARCDCASANPHDYNCAPGSLAAATCAANTSGDVCCPFTD